MIVRNGLVTPVWIDRLLDLPEELQHVVLDDRDDGVRHEPVPFAVDGRQIRRAWRPGEAERGSGVGVEPVGQELDAVLRGHGEVDHVRLCDLLGGDARDVVAVHEQWHQVWPPARSETSRLAQGNRRMTVARKGPASSSSTGP